MLSSCRRLYLCFAVIFAAGTACALADKIAWLFWAAIVLCIPIVFSTPRTFTQRQQSEFGRSSNWRSYLVLLLTLILSFGYAKWRLASTAPEPLLKYAGRSAILVGKLLEKLPCHSPDCDNYSLLIEKIVFPQNHILKLKTPITIRRNKNQTEEPQTLLLNQRRLFRVAVRAQLNRDVGDYMNSTSTATHASTAKDISPHTDAESPQTNTETSQTITEMPKIPAVAKPVPNHVFLTCAQQDISEYDTTASISPETGWQKAISTIEGITEATRRGIVEAHIVALSNERGGLLASMVLGDKAIKLPDEIIRNFRAIGLSHIVAASGFNLTIVISMSFFISATILQTERQRALFTLSVLFFYVLLAGFSPSIVRAAIMCFILVISRLTKRKSQITATIATALLLTILLDPHALLDLGLQLSYAATLGITCGAQPLSELLQISPTRIGRAIADVTSSCLMAQLSVLPLQVLSFWNANVLFLIANILVLPLVGPITMVGFASSIVSIGALVFPLSKCITQTGCNAIDSIISIPLNYILWISNYLTTLSWAHLRLGKPDLAQVVFYYVCYLIFLIAMRRQWHRSIVVTLPVCAVIVLMMRSPSADMTVGALRTSTVIFNSQKDAAILSVAKQKTDEQAIDKFLNFAAVRNSVTTNTTPQTIGSIKTEQIGDACSIYIDADQRLGAVYAPSPYSLRLALDSCGEVLGRLHEAEERVLIVRMDAEQNRGKEPAAKPEQSCTTIAKVMQACGLEKAVLIFSNRQYQRFAPVFRTVCSDSSLERHTVAVLSDKSLTVITLSRKQLGAHFASE
jgi:ComEC/Rec2-related protein